MTKIAVIIGSLRAESWNKLLAKTLETLIPEGSEFIYADLKYLQKYIDTLIKHIEENKQVT